MSFMACNLKASSMKLPEIHVIGSQLKNVDFLDLVENSLRCWRILMTQQQSDASQVCGRLMIIAMPTMATATTTVMSAPLLRGPSAVVSNAQHSQAPKWPLAT